MKALTYTLLGITNPSTTLVCFAHYYILLNMLGGKYTHAFSNIVA